MEFCCLAVTWLFCIALAAYIGEAKGRRGLGFVLGFVFGPLGVLIVAVLPLTLGKEVERRIEIERRMQAAMAPPPPDAFLGEVPRPSFAWDVRYVAGIVVMVAVIVLLILFGQGWPSGAEHRSKPRRAAAPIPTQRVEEPIADLKGCSRWRESTTDSAQLRRHIEAIAQRLRESLTSGSVVTRASLINSACNGCWDSVESLGGTAGECCECVEAIIDRLRSDLDASP